MSQPHLAHRLNLFVRRIRLIISTHGIRLFGAYTASSIYEFRGGTLNVLLSLLATPSALLSTCRMSNVISSSDFGISDTLVSHFDPITTAYQAQASWALSPPPTISDAVSETTNSPGAPFSIAVSSAPLLPLPFSCNCAPANYTDLLMTLFRCQMPNQSTRHYRRDTPKARCMAKSRVACAQQSLLC